MFLLPLALLAFSFKGSSSWSQGFRNQTVTHHSMAPKSYNLQDDKSYSMLHCSNSTGKAPNSLSPPNQMSSPRGQRQFSWPSALIGAAAATAGLALLYGRPRDPTVHVVSITLSSFRLNLPLLDLELSLTVHVTNPNLVPITYAPATVSISYRGSHLGSARLRGGAQPARSCQLVHLPARLDGLQMAQHAGPILADVARREMRLDAEVAIDGAARMLFLERRFSARVESHVVVDPVFLDVVEQDNTTETHLLA